MHSGVKIRWANMRDGRSGGLALPEGVLRPIRIGEPHSPVCMFVRGVFGNQVQYARRPLAAGSNGLDDDLACRQHRCGGGQGKHESVAPTVFTPRATDLIPSVVPQGIGTPFQDFIAAPAKPAVVPHARLVGAGIPDIIQHGDDGEEEGQIPWHAHIAGNHAGNQRGGFESGCEEFPDIAERGVFHECADGEIARIGDAAVVFIEQGFGGLAAPEAAVHIVKELAHPESRLVVVMVLLREIIPGFMNPPIRNLRAKRNLNAGNCIEHGEAQLSVEHIARQHAFPIGAGPEPGFYGIAGYAHGVGDRPVRQTTCEN